MANALEAASLVMIPSGYENGTLGSLKPLDGSGDFTFTRGSDISATRVNEDGYIEKGYENTLLGSNDWAQSDSQYEITGGEVGYDGTNDAWLVNKLAAAYFSKDALVLAGVMTISFFAKAGSLDRVFVFIGGDAARFDLTNATAVTAGGNPVSQNIELVSGTTDWYRCSIVINKTSTQNFLIKPQNSSNQDVTGTIYIQDAMLNQGMVSYPYVETTTAPVAGGILEDEPRLDYSGGASCPSLLLEPQRTNFITQSEYIDGSYWTKDRVTISNNATTSPEGKLNASKIIEDSQNGIHRIFRTISGTNNVLSFFAKADERQWISVFSSDASYSYFNVGDGTLGTIASGSTATIEDYGNGWYRCSLHNFYSSSAIINITTGNGDAAYQGDGTSGLYIYGIQVEQATYPTSYIPTYGTSQTRLRDNVNRLDISSLAATYQTLFIEASVFSVSTTQYKFSINDATGSRTNRFTIFINNDDLLLLVNSQGSSQPAIAQSDYISVNTTYKIAAVVRDGSYALFANGTKIGEQVGTTPSNLNSLTFGDASSPNNQSWYGDVNQTLVFPTALSDDECIALTTIS